MDSLKPDRYSRVLPQVIFREMIGGKVPLLALAPMQDVSGLSCWRLLSRYGGADVYWTEYFRVHADSHLEKWILESITKNPTGKPVVAQMIGNDIPSLIRSARELLCHPIAGIDLNLGCPAPVVYRKCAGGGLLRDMKTVDAILGQLRQTIPIPFTVKTRIGFDTPAVYDELLALIAKHQIDLLTVHGRTVKQMYTGQVRYDLIARAARSLSCPVLANGDIHSPAQASRLLNEAPLRGLMIGRGAIRNPWIFDQIRAQLQGRKPELPTGRDVLAYVLALWESEITPGVRESSQVQRMKKFMNFIGEGLEMSGDFLYHMRRATTRADFFQLCERHLDHNRPLTLEPAETKNVSEQSSGKCGKAVDEQERPL
jgi:tRNA-dihydrouridine synthase